MVAAIFSNANWWITNPVNNFGNDSDPRDNLGAFPSAKGAYRRVDGPHTGRNFRVEGTDGGSDNVANNATEMHVIAADRFTPADPVLWPNAATFFTGLVIARHGNFADDTPPSSFYVTRVLSYDNATGLLRLKDPMPGGALFNARFTCYDPDGIASLAPAGPFFRTPTLAEFETGVTQYTPLVWRTASVLASGADWPKVRAFLSLDDPGEADIEIMFSTNNDPGGPDEVTGFMTEIADDTIVPTTPHFYGTNQPGRFSAPVSWALSDQPSLDSSPAVFPENRFFWIKRTVPAGFMPKKSAYVQLLVETDADDPDTGLSPPQPRLTGFVLTWTMPDYISGELEVTKDRSVYIGGGAKIIASVKPGGVPVEGIPVSWELENVSSPPVNAGALAGTADSITDENGEAQVTYIAPTNKAAGDSPGPHVKVKART